MKTCEYCGKPIDYDHAFCNEECENNTFLYYKKRKHWQRFFGLMNTVGIVTVLLGLLAGIISKMVKLGLLITGGGILLTGIIYVLFPYYGLDEQIKHKGIITSTKTVRMIGLIAILIGILCVVGGIIVSLQR